MATAISSLTTLTPKWPKSTPKLPTLYQSFSNNASRFTKFRRISTNSTIQGGAKPTKNAADYASASAHSRGLVFDLGSGDSWDCAEIGSPVVKRYLSDEEERWYMWYHGRSGENQGTDSIGLAVSGNGIHWNRGERVMNRGEDWWAFDTKGVRPGEVLVMSNSKVGSKAVYWLYYAGFSSEKVDFPADFRVNLLPELPTELSPWGHFPADSRFPIENPETVGVFKSLPGLAMSQDGKNWARIEGEHHTGALLDVGSEGEWDSLFIASPHVVFHGIGDLRMYYHSFDVFEGRFSVGLARSRDGIRWEKQGKVLQGSSSKGEFDEQGAVNACVVRGREGGKYVMAYEGVAADGRRSSSIGIAVSDDGLKEWRRLEEGSSSPAVERSEDGGWDDAGVGSPCLVQMDGDEWRLYYRGVGKEGRTGIGMAVSKNGFGEFRKIDSMSFV